MALENIQKLADRYAATRNVLTEKVHLLQGEMEAVKRSKLTSIKKALAKAVEAHDQLHAAIEAHPELFSKPKTHTFTGIRVGYMKQKGKVTIPDEEDTIRRIREQLPKAQAELLISVKESVAKSGVADLTAKDLKRLGITVTADSDQVTIKPVDGSVDKLVNALLKEAEQIGEAT